ncbi:MAG TPA: aldo/keto reductase [Firmicutes bacterium]|nr:aldo/keto reductase [Bacillota bacterium]
MNGSAPNPLTPNPALYRVPFTTDDFNGMPYRQLGSSGFKVSNVGLGTWKIGYPETGDDSRIGRVEALKLLDRAVELGVTFWDTANRYNEASGNSERVIGEWFRTHPDQRRNVVLATKIFGGMDGRTPNHSRLSRGAILDAVYASLKRLQLDYIDLLYFHRFDPITPVEESLAAIEDLVQRDLVRYFAVSNFTVDQLKIYRAAEISVRSRIVAVQNKYDILNGESAEHQGVLAYAAAHGISFVAYSPLAMGLLTERYLDPAKVGPGDRLYDQGMHDQYRNEAVRTKLEKLTQLAAGWGLSLSQLALAYMLDLPGMGPVIPSATKISQLESNAAAGRIKLDTAQKTAVLSILQ